jgi:tetratricopeptide (TPR) repeat protein
MRGAILTWSNLTTLPLSFGMLAILGGPAALSAEHPAASVKFVDRDTLGTAALSNSGNPLRAGSVSATRASDGNALRDEAATDAPEGEQDSVRVDPAVTPAGYNARSTHGLPLRPYKPPTGIFSGVFHGKESRPPEPRATPNGRSSAAADRTKGLVPQLMSSASKYGLTRNSATGSPARAGSANHSPVTTAMPSRTTTRSNAPMQASYNTAAAAAQSYYHVGMDEHGSSHSSVGEHPAASRSGHPSASTTHVATRTDAARSPRLVTPEVHSEKSGGPTSRAAQTLIRAHQLAGSARGEEDYSRIISTCEQIPANEASNEETKFGRDLASWAFNRRGQLRAKDGRTDEALNDFNLAVQLDPTRWRAIHNRGVLNAQAGNLEQAFDDFDQTIALNPDFAKAYSNRAALYVLAGELEPALRDYQQAAKLDPKLAIARRGCGRTYHMLGRFDEALKHFDTAIELAPGDATAYTNRGDLLTDLGRYSEAAADYEHALNLDSNSAEACRSSAWLLATCPDESVRDPKLALQRATLAARRDRRPNAVTFDTLAAAQACNGDFDQAVESIRRAIEIAPASERSVYQDRLRLYRRSQPLFMEPISGGVQQAQYQQ